MVGFRPSRFFVQYPTCCVHAFIRRQTLVNPPVAGFILCSHVALTFQDCGRRTSGNYKESMAERVGFEPTIPCLTGYRFSRAGPSATRQPLRTTGVSTMGAVKTNHLFLPFITLLSGGVNIPKTGILACRRASFLVSTLTIRQGVPTLHNY